MKRYWRKSKSVGSTQYAVGKIRTSILGLVAYCLLAIAYCLLFDIGVASCSRRKDHSEVVTYTCPMHPTVIQDKPGTCQVCGMELVLQGKQESVKITAELDYLLKPVNATVISSIKLITPVQKSMNVKIKTNGVITYDTRTTATISSRFNGRIEKLFVKYNFQPIRKGQKILEIYSAELLTAQRDLLYLIKSDKENTQLIEGAKEKLKLLGASDEQTTQVISTGQVSSSFVVYSGNSGYIINSDGAVNQSELQLREGMYVSAGQTILKIADANSIWAEFDIYSKDISSIKVNDPCQLRFDGAPDAVEGRVNFVQPFYKNGEDFTKVRVYLQNNNNGQLRVGQLVKASFDKPLPGSLWIPISAQLDLGTKKIVFIRKDAMFQPHEIAVGHSSDGWIEVLKGVDVSDSIAYNAQFLVDSESFIKTKN